MDIQKSYECLTDQTKFDNWVTYGNPDGSILLQTMDIPLPSFLKNEGIYQILNFCILTCQVKGDKNRPNTTIEEVYFAPDLFSLEI